MSVFPQVIADFEDRVKEVDLYFQLLLSLENEEFAIVAGMGRQVVPVGKPPADWASMLKGAAYLVLYNLVEAFVRRGFQAVFDAIRNDGICGSDLIEVLRNQWIAQRNRKVKAFDGSPKVYIGIAGEIVREVIAKQAASMSHDLMPIVGNIDADIVKKVFSDHGVEFKVPKAARGGVSLATVKAKRNSLAHGVESFVEAGRNAVATTFVIEKTEVVLFMRSVLDNLEKYSTAKSYKAR